MRAKKRYRNNFKAILKRKTWSKMHSLKIEMWRTCIDVNRALNHTHTSKISPSTQSFEQDIRCLSPKHA